MSTPSLETFLTKYQSCSLLFVFKQRNHYSCTSRGLRQIKTINWTKIWWFRTDEVPIRVLENNTHTERLDAKCSYQQTQGHNEMTRSQVPSAMVYLKLYTRENEEFYHLNYIISILRPQDTSNGVSYSPCDTQSKVPPCRIPYYWAYIQPRR